MIWPLSTLYIAKLWISTQQGLLSEFRQQKRKRTLEFIKYNLKFKISFFQLQLENLESENFKLKELFN